MKNFQKYCLLVLLIIVCGMFSVRLQNKLSREAALASFTMEEAESEAFRAMHIGTEVIEDVFRTADKEELPRMELLASMLFDNEYDLLKADSKTTDSEKTKNHLFEKQKQKPEQLYALTQALNAVWADIACFPVPVSSANPDATVSYEDSWMYQRTYGGERSHEGTDLMADINERGYYPVVSMTDGVVEKIGWLPKGGYRIGIRSPSGGYFYYAHLASYAEEFKEGDPVRAGDLLGMMGDTGYSEIEGTTGMFDVHLHLGIYIRTENYEELSVNPYYVLKYMESKKLVYQF